MSSKEVFTAAVGWMKMYGDFLREVVAEIGLPRTIELHTKHGETFGAMFVDGLKKMGGFTPEAMGKLIDQAYLPMGLINLESKATPDTLVVKNGKCPVYEGFKMAGLDDETIDKLCTNREGAVYAAITEVFPEVKASMTRNKPDGYCTFVYKVGK